MLCGRQLLCRTDKQANVQEGHGAIVPVDPMNIPEDVFKFMAKVKGASPTTGLMTPSQRKLYDLVWRRALSSQMAVARLKQVITIQVHNLTAGVTKPQ